jgi:NADP-dependent 3-hydroxy acid dehydrogenase YdfG
MNAAITNVDVQDKGNTRMEDISAGRILGQIAVVTGASSGIGKAIALALAGEGAQVCLIGRNLETLEAVANRTGMQSPKARAYQTDLTRDGDIQALAASLNHDAGRVDILIHSAGEIHHGVQARALVAELDAQYRANVHGPYLLTQALLPLLRLGPGQIVFINSSTGLKARAGNGQFAATQHALRALTDSLRDEVNADGIRVLSVYPGRTATPRTAALFAREQRPYRPELLMQAEDIASMVVHALTLPRTAEVTDIAMRPLRKSY